MLKAIPPHATLCDEGKWSPTTEAIDPTMPTTAVSKPIAHMLRGIIFLIVSNTL
ncbi:TPA: hypothetical protein VDU83_002529 [Pseudomonas aeruginosa]|nr:hypothetical protein [Pseudomonas aeruginosa]